MSLKTGKIGSFTLVLASVVVIIFSLRIWLIPHQDKSVPTRGQIQENQVQTASSLIPDFANMKPVSKKKRAFFDYLKPLVEKQNSLIADERASLLSALEHVNSQHQLTQAEQYRVQQLSEKYSYRLRNIDAESLNELLKRVDIVPMDMVLIQAANETGWGTSRFAREGLNFFGQWCFTKGCGLVPQSRTQGMSHEVAVFKSVADSVASYMRNLNTNAAYRLFRSIRADLRAQGLQPTASKLIYGLVNYSERQDAYIDELLDMLRHNKKYLVNTHAQQPSA